MIFIDLANKKPTDTDIPNWAPWTSPQWNAWQAKSVQLVAEMETLEAAGKRNERNALIDANSAHWGKLKPWLEALSGGKCWFSEVRELYSHYDVEHFRPKKQAKSLDGIERDGYWWLAFDYTNFRLCGSVGNRKKGGWFPLRDGSLISTYKHRCEESEAIYLLDPVDATDVNLIAFDEEGKAIPAPNCSDWEKQRVDESVKRLKLNEHPPLPEARRKIWQRMTGLINGYLEAKARCSTGTNPAATEKLRGICKQVRKMTKHTEELSAVARWCVLVRNDPQLSRLIG
jgi:hypothetical protein